MPEYGAAKVVRSLNDRRKSLMGSKGLFWALLTKNVDDRGESPAVEVMELLRDADAEVAYSYPHVPVFPKMRGHNFNLCSIMLTSETVADYDAIVLTTDHAKFDYDMIRANAQVIVDSRGVYREPA